MGSSGGGMFVTAPGHREKNEEIIPDLYMCEPEDLKRELDDSVFTMLVGMKYSICYS